MKEKVKQYDVTSKAALIKHIKETSLVLKDYLGIAQYLSKHPILNEPENNRMKYLETLYWVALKYSQKNAYATSLMKVYHDTLINDPSVSQSVDCIKPRLMNFSATRFKWFKFYTYRYMFLIDCLFINSFCDNALSQTILNDLLSLSHKRFHKNLIHLFDVLFEHTTDKRFIEQNNLVFLAKSWLSNREFIAQEKRTVLVTANMGAGKSTLINALVGKRVSRTKHKTCTAKLHYIYDKPFEDGLSYEMDHILDLNADIDTLMNDNVQNKTTEISVGTYYRTIVRKNSRFCIIDTPGVNSYQYPEHRDITENAIRSIRYDKLIYIANGDNIGTDDDKIHLQFLGSIVDKDKLIFVLNKLDGHKGYEDSIRETINDFRKELSEYGFVNAHIYPVSAYAAGLAKKFLYCEQMNEEEEHDLMYCMKKFKKPEFDLDSYFGSRVDDHSEFPSMEIDSEKTKECVELIRKVGMLSIEKILMSKE